MVNSLASPNEHLPSYSPEVSKAYDTYFLKVRGMISSPAGLAEEEIETAQIKAVELREKHLAKVGCSELLRAMAIYGHSEEGDMPELVSIWQSIKEPLPTESEAE